MGGPPPALPSPALIDDADRVAEIAAAIGRAGVFALDLEFVSQDRYVPDLALVQVGWGEPERPEVAAIDPLAVDVEPLVRLVADPAVEVVAHAARQDLGLLAARFDITAAGLWDTQIASAFAGLPDQVGYARMVQELAGVTLDKGSQFTNWHRRPLSQAQVRYALADVEHLLVARRELEARLRQRGRLGWAAEESARLALTAARRRAPEELYRSIGGANGLDGGALAVLRELAAWREREALSSNTPPSWLASDQALVELARRAGRRGAADLGKVRGLPPGTARTHGRALADAIERGLASPPPEKLQRSQRPATQAQAAMVGAIIQARAADADLPVRLVGGKADHEALVEWYAAGAAEGERGEVALAGGWRHQLCGRDALAWLAGEISLAADPGRPGGVRLIALGD